MEIRVFPTESEWKTVLNRCLIYIVWGSISILAFWMGWLDHTHEVARGSWNLPRQFDCVFFILWVGALVLWSRFVQWVCKVPFDEKDDWIHRVLLDFGRRGTVVFISLLIPISSIFGVWGGADLGLVTRDTLLVFFVVAVYYMLLSLPLAVNRWLNRRWPNRLRYSLPR